MRRLHPVFVVAFFLLVSANSFAEISRTRLQVDVTSICQDSSLAAGAANAAIVDEVLGLYRSYAVDPNDRIAAAVNVNILARETAPQGSETRVLCEYKWRSVNTLIFETGDGRSLDELRAQIAALNEQSAVDPALEAQTFVTVK